MRTLFLSLGMILTFACMTRAADYSGKYANPQITLELAKAGDAYTGTMTITGKPYPVTAAENAGRLTGQFDVGGSKFDFSATIEGGNLKLNSGGREYLLANTGAPPANPLEGVPVTPPAGPNPPQPPVAQPPAQALTSQEAARRLRQLPVGPANPNREWTILVHLNADNDLEKFGVDDLNEMERGLTNSNVEIIVLMDRCEGFDERDGDWKGARIYRVVRDDNPALIASEVLMELGEINMADEDVIAGYVEGALKAYPARQTAMIMWNHGGGWASMSVDFACPGKDGSDSIQLGELRGALQKALPAAGKEKLSIIGFDMCLMAQIETATELADLAEVMVASQAIEPGRGWPYDVVIPAFGKGTAGARRIGADIVTAFNDYYKTVSKEKVATLSALDLSLTAEFNSKLDALLEKYEPTMQQTWPTLARAIFYGEQYCDRTDYKKGVDALATFDIMDILKRLRHASPNFVGEKEYRDFMAVADRFVMLSANSERHHLSNGIAVYAPVNAQLVNPEYNKLLFSQKTKWFHIISKMHNQQLQDTKPPVFSEIRLTDSTDQPVPAVKPLAGHRYQLSVTGNNIIYTQAWLGRRMPGIDGLVLDSKSFVMDAEWILRYAEAKETAHEVDLLMPKYKDGESKLKDDIPGLTLVLTNGQESTTCTMDGSDLGNDTYRILALLSHKDLGKDPVLGIITFDTIFLEAVQIVGMMPQPDGKTRPRAIEPAPDLKISPIHEVLTDDGKIKLHTFKTIAWNKGLGFRLETMPPGDYEAVLTAETMGGVTSTTRGKFKMAEDPELTKFNQTWKFFRPDMMVGTWDVAINTPDANQKPFWKVKVEATKQPDVYKADVDVLTDGTKLQILMILDRSGLPHMKLIIVGKDGKFEGMILGPSLFDMTKEGNPLLLMKMVNLSGLNTIWKRQETTTIDPNGGGGGQMDESHLQPVQVPDPRPVQLPQMQQQRPPQNQQWNW